MIAGAPILVELQGRAWSGRARITRVEVSADGGEAWGEAEVSEPASPHSWQRWCYLWDAATPGAHELLCRAHDSSCDAQTGRQVWTARGMGNNMAQRVRVVVV
jgi:hypothetical protein